MLAACASGEDDTAVEAPPEPAPADAPADAPEDGDDEQQFPVFTDPSIPTLDAIFERDRFTVIGNTIPAVDRTWQHVFDEVNIVYSEDPVAPLVSGAAWFVQAEPGIIWPAMEQGVVDAKIVGVSSSVEAWLLLVAEHIETPEDLIGARISAGAIGDTWINVGRIILRDHFGIDPDDLEWVSMGGGADQRMDALVAGQIDAFMGQPRNTATVVEAGGRALFDERVDNAQLQFVVLTETMENNRDAVCAALEGALEANQWIASSDAPEQEDIIPEVLETLERYGYDPEGGEAQWRASYPHTWAFDLGAPASSFDTQLEVIAGGEDPIVSADFPWRDHVDFSCLWELQEAYGLPLNPDPGTL